MTVSIIIPVYNVAPYIERCLQSVASQTYKGAMECLIIDDCGQDDSIQLAEQFVASYQGTVDFRIIHHDHNKGLSAARNTGIKESIGEWVYFLDSDDWITDDCLLHLLRCVQKCPKVEMIMGNINVVGADYNWKFLPEGNYEESLIEAACSYQIYTMAWNKLLRKDFIIRNSLYFEEGLLHEDILWNVQVACFLKSLYSIQEKTYNYLVRKGSIQTNESFLFHQKHLWNVKILLITFIFENGFSKNATLYQYVKNGLYDYIFRMISTGYQEVAKSFYKQLRLAPYWSLSFVKSQSVGIMDCIFAIHRFLPISCGIEYLLIIRKISSLKIRRKII